MFHILLFLLFMCWLLFDLPKNLIVLCCMFSVDIPEGSDLADRTFETVVVPDSVSA